MPLEIIFFSILLVSLAGIAFILFNKIPILLKMPESNFKRDKMISSIKENVKRGIRKIPGAKKFDYELYLQKALSKVRVLTLKTESKTGNWLEKLRKRRNGHNHNDDYWEELKKAKDGK